MKLEGENIVRVDFTDGAYKNFEKCQKISEGIYYIFAPGHTTGNSIVIVEDLPDDWKCPRCKQAKNNFNRA